MIRVPCHTLKWPFTSSPSSWVAIETLTERETALLGSSLREAEMRW